MSIFVHLVNSKTLVNQLHKGFVLVERRSTYYFIKGIIFLLIIFPNIRFFLFQPAPNARKAQQFCQED